MRVMLGSITAAVGVCLVLVVAPAAAAESTSAPPLKSEIDGFLRQLDARTGGVVTWDGAGRIDVREDGDAAIADIDDARFSVGKSRHGATAERAVLTLGHVEIRQTPEPDGAFALAVTLPREAVLRAADGEETAITLDGASADAVIDAQSGRAREFSLAVAHSRIDIKKSGDWVKFGPLSLSSKLVGAGDGGWQAPVDFAVQDIEFFLTEGPASGAVGRIAYRSRSAGPDLAALNRLRDRLDALRRQKDMPPKERTGSLLALLPELPSLFSLARGELTVADAVVRAPTGKPLAAVKKASLGGALTGLSGDAAALRVTLTEDGLALAPGILDKDKVPRRVVLDLGLEHVDTAILRRMLEALGKLPGGRQAMQHLIAAAAELRPVIRVYDLAVDTPAVGVEAKGEAKGSPLAPKGYSAAADVSVRGFDALPDLVGKAPLAQFLPLLAEIGTAAKADDGTPHLAFHLASTPQKWLTINGDDVTAWFAPAEAVPGEWRLLRPADPPLKGDDVRAVQRALAEANIAVPHSGVYDAATAAAVARFQRNSGLNVDGVVDAATRRELGLAPKPAVMPGSGKGAN